MTGVITFISELKVFWKEWDVRSFIVASFVFQLILILIAPFRKRTSNLFVRISTWISYLLADWVAAQAVGLIARATQDSRSAESDLFGLWAQFLLLHLGGPDTITALALEDNELWLRTALHLGTQAYATLGILVRSVRHSSLWVATVLMFLVGFIKYLERVTSLHHGRLLDIANDPYKKYMTKLSMIEGGNEEEQKKLSNEAMVRDSYLFFQAYKSLYSDLPLKRDVQASSRKYFLKRSSAEAYKMVAIQLNFMYEAMYTKMDVMHKMSCWFLRHIVFSLQVGSFVIWCLWDKRGFQAYDVRVTYALLIGAIAVDLVAFVRINRSDWNTALCKKEPADGSSSRIMSGRWALNHAFIYDVLRACGNMWSWLLDVYESRARRSMHISRYIGSSLDNCLDEVAKCLHLQDNGHNRHEVKLDRCVSPIWDLIFEMLTKPCEQVCYELPSGSNMIININELLRRAFPIHILDYHTIIQYWYNVLKNNSQKQHQKFKNYRCIAEYLAYLIAFQPDMMYAAAGKGRVVTLQNESFWLNTSDELFPLEGEGLEEEEEGDGRIRMKEIFGLLTLESNREKGRVKDAKDQMCKVKDYVEAEEKWEVLGRIWGELLCHAAITCKPNVHAAKLKEGGEFLSFVWLLMVHLGIEARASI